MKSAFTARNLFIARLVFDLILCIWQVILVKAADVSPATPFYADPMAILAITNPAVTLLSTTIFSDATLAREWIWVPLYLICDAAIWGGLWIIIHWLNRPTEYP